MHFTSMGILGLAALAGLAQAAPDPANLHRVAYDDAGTANAQPHLVAGARWTYPESAVPEPAGGGLDRTIAFGDAVCFGYGGMSPEALYGVIITLLSETSKDTRSTATS